MSRLIRNRRNNFVPLVRTPNMMFLCEIPKNKIFTYSTGMRAYVATGAENENEIEAICIATSSWNTEALGRKTWLKKRTLKKSRNIGDKFWPTEIKNLKRQSVPEENHYIKTTRFSKWLSTARTNTGSQSTWGFRFTGYEPALVNSELVKERYMQTGRIERIGFL